MIFRTNLSTLNVGLMQEAGATRKDFNTVLTRHVVIRSLSCECACTYSAHKSSCVVKFVFSSTSVVTAIPAPNRSRNKCVSHNLVCTLSHGSGARWLELMVFCSVRFHGDRDRTLPTHSAPYLDWTQPALCGEG